MFMLSVFMLKAAIKPISQTVITLSDVKLSVITLGVVMLSVNMQSVAMLSIITLSVIMLNVVAPSELVGIGLQHRRGESIEFRIKLLCFITKE
jgi:hypothetical protein